MKDQVKHYYKLSLTNFSKDLDTVTKKMLYKRRSCMGQEIPFETMQDAIMQSLTETGEYQYITYEHFRVINRICAKEYRHGMKKVDIDNADNELTVKCFADDVTNDMLCQSLFDDTTITDDDKRMFAYLYDGYKLGEISSLLNVPVSRLKQRLYRLRKSLQYLVLDSTSEYTREQTNKIMEHYLNDVPVQNIARNLSIPLSDVRQIIKRETSTRGHVMAKYIPSFA